MNRGILPMDEDGMVAVEFAFISLMLIGIILATIDFSLMLFNRQVLFNAAREGARAGVMAGANRLSDDAIKLKVKALSEKHLITFKEDGGPKVAISPAGRKPDEARFQDDLEVTVEYTYNYLYLSYLKIPPHTIKIISTMKME